MCLICRGLKKGKLSVEEAREKYEDMLDLIDEDHQEIIEDMLAEFEEDANYWRSATRDYLRKDNDDPDEEEAMEEALFDDEYEDEE
jgi:alpha-glucuronidase